MERFHDPNVRMSRIYTRTGDAGETGLVGGQRVPKDDLRIDAYGTVDELGALVGLAVVEARAENQPALEPLMAALVRVQHQLFNLGSVLSTLPQDLAAGQPRPTDQDVTWLEHSMDACNQHLVPLRSFVLAGGSRLNAVLHLARTVCRRAERIVVGLRRSGGCGDLEVRYLNRLSDALFVWAREASHLTRQPEVLWEPNRA